MLIGSRQDYPATASDLLLASALDLSRKGRILSINLTDGYFNDKAA